MNVFWSFTLFSLFGFVLFRVGGFCLRRVCVRNSHCTLDLFRSEVPLLKGPPQDLNLKEYDGYIILISIEQEFHPNYDF